jgi:hypothetical protein
MVICYWCILLCKLLFGCLKSWEPAKWEGSREAGENFIKCDIFGNSLLIFGCHYVSDLVPVQPEFS